jgi:hypothetical protein
MKKLVLVLLSILTGGFTIAQTSYYKYVNEPNIASSSFSSCLATNSGYIFAGSASNLIFDSNFLITRITTTGTVQQMRSFTASGYNNITSIIQTIDGEYAYWGTEGNNTTFVNSLALLKTDIVGNYLINKTYSNPNYSLTSTKFVQDAQGNYYLLANASNTQTFEDEICIIKTDAAGNLLSQKFISLGVNTSSMDIVATSGNEILVTGYANNGSSIETIAVFKLDLNLSLIWNKWYASTTEKFFHYDVKEKANGSFIFSGRYDDTINPYSTLVMEIDNNGNLAWAKKYSSIDNSRVHGYSIKLNSSGDAIVAGGIDRGLGTGPVMAMSINASNGSVNWSKFLNSGAQAENIYAIDITSSGDILACGYRGSSASIIKASSTFDLCSDSLYGISETSLAIPTQSASATISNAAITAGTWSKTPVAFTTITDACTNVGIEESESGLTFAIYPNPVANELHLESALPLNSIRIFDATGRLVADIECKNKFNLDINTSSLVKGFYNVQIQTEKSYRNVSFIKSE